MTTKKLKSTNQKLKSTKQNRDLVSGRGSVDLADAVEFMDSQMLARPADPLPATKSGDR